MTAKEASALVVARLSERHRPRIPGRPVLVGIGGGSAGGKSTLARALVERLAPLRVEVTGQDRFFKPAAELPPYPSPSREKPWPDYNRPDSFRTAELLAHLRGIAGCEVAILEGILVLHDEEVRGLLDLRCYVAAAADERIVRRIRRNVAAGIPLDDVADYYLESVRFQHERFNAPTAAHADLVIPGGAAEAQVREEMVDGIVEGIRTYLER